MIVRKPFNQGAAAPILWLREQTGARCLTQAQITPVNPFTIRTTRMKRHLNHLLQHTRSRFESTNATRRITAPRNTIASTGLRTEDGYDWLRQIKPVHARHPAAR